MPLWPTRGDWIRNNPDKDRSVSDEIGDVLMMLTVFSEAMGIDPVQAMLEKMKKEGVPGGRIARAGVFNSFFAVSGLQTGPGWMKWCSRRDPLP